MRVIWSQGEKAAHNATLLVMWVEKSEEFNPKIYKATITCSFTASKLADAKYGS